MIQYMNVCKNEPIYEEISDAGVVYLLSPKYSLVCNKWNAALAGKNGLLIYFLLYINLYSMWVNKYLEDKGVSAWEGRK